MNGRQQSFYKLATLTLCCTSIMGCWGGTKSENNEKTESSTPLTKKEEITMTTLESGLKYQTLQAAPENAESPKKGQQVTVHYTGWLNKDGEPGTKFDSSVDRGKKFSFIIGAGQVIKGWDEGVINMKIGEKRRLLIPSKLGYGARGAGSAIPPNADLIFDVELFEVK